MYGGEENVTALGRWELTGRGTVGFPKKQSNGGRRGAGLFVINLTLLGGGFKGLKEEKYTVAFEKKKYSYVRIGEGKGNRAPHVSLRQGERGGNPRKCAQKFLTEVSKVLTEIYFKEMVQRREEGASILNGKGL